MKMSLESFLQCVNYETRRLGVDVIPEVRFNNSLVTMLHVRVEGTLDYAMRVNFTEVSDDGELDMVMSALLASLRKRSAEQQKVPRGLRELREAEELAADNISRANAAIRELWDEYMCHLCDSEGECELQSSKGLLNIHTKSDGLFITAKADGTLFVHRFGGFDVSGFIPASGDGLKKAIVDATRRGVFRLK